MCGIAGIIHYNNKPVSSEIVQKMIDVINHRGPDDQETYIANGIGLGHARLSIIDLSDHGRQPMCNEDGSVWIVFNGEIYNYKLLNQALKKKGHQFRSHCDTETIIHLYEEYGNECIQHLRGMFSFAIWDRRKKKLFCAVDRLRIKPFYYTQLENKLIFASELKAILASGQYQKKINMEAVHHFLSMQAIPVPLTIYENVYTLPGGYSLEYNKGRISISKYWDNSYCIDHEGSESYFIKRLRDLLYESVEIRLMSDVPLGAFLSGGIDSSIIVGLMKDMKEDPIKTFSIGYDVGGHDYDDTYYANLVSKKFGTNHTVQTLTCQDVLNELISFIGFLDQPSTDAINSYFVSKLAKKEVTVVLCGQGGDELFAGYQTFHLMQKFMNRDQKWEKLPFWLQKGIISTFHPLQKIFGDVGKIRSFGRFLTYYGSFIKKYSFVRMELSEEEKHRSYTEMMSRQLQGIDTHQIYAKYYEQLQQCSDPLNQVAYLDLKTHLGDVLMRDVDVMSMAFSLETRIPLIDHKLVEFVSTIPSELKLKNGIKKYILIESMKDLLPEEVINRPKLGFAFPFNIWLRHDLRPLVDFVLSKSAVQKRGFFRYDVLEGMKQDFYRGKNNNYRKIWGFVILELWLRLVEEGDYDFFDRLQKHVQATW